MVNNGSTDVYVSVEHIRKTYPNLVLIETGKNLGYAGGNNVGISYGAKHSAEYVLILNNDIKVKPNTLTAIVEVAKQSRAIMVGASVKMSRMGKFFSQKPLSCNALLFRTTRT